MIIRSLHIWHSFSCLLSTWPKLCKKDLLSNYSVVQNCSWAMDSILPSQHSLTSLWKVNFQRAFSHQGSLPLWRLTLPGTWPSRVGIADYGPEAMPVVKKEIKRIFHDTWKLCGIRIPGSKNKGLLNWATLFMYYHCVCGCFLLQQQSWARTTETFWPADPETVSVWPFTEELADPARETTKLNWQCDQEIWPPFFW